MKRERKEKKNASKRNVPKTTLAEAMNAVIGYCRHSRWPYSCIEWSLPLRDLLRFRICVVSLSVFIVLTHWTQRTHSARHRRRERQKEIEGNAHTFTPNKKINKTKKKFRFETRKHQTVLTQHQDEANVFCMKQIVRARNFTNFSFLPQFFLWFVLFRFVESWAGGIFFP